MFLQDAERIAAHLKGVDAVIHPNSLALSTNEWRVVFYLGPTEHIYAGLAGDGDAALEVLDGVVTDEMFTAAETKWRWDKAHPMYMHGWGKYSRRDIQRGVNVPDVLVPEKLVFGVIPESMQKKRRRAKK